MCKKSIYQSIVLAILLVFCFAGCREPSEFKSVELNENESAVVVTLGNGEFNERSFARALIRGGNVCMRFVAQTVRGNIGNVVCMAASPGASVNETFRKASNFVGSATLGHLTGATVVSGIVNNVAGGTVNKITEDLDPFKLKHYSCSDSAKKDHNKYCSISFKTDVIADKMKLEANTNLSLLQARVGMFHYLYNNYLNATSTSERDTIRSNMNRVLRQIIRDVKKMKIKDAVVQTVATCSCETREICDDPQASNYNEYGECMYEVAGCMEAGNLAYDPLATFHDDSMCDYVDDSTYDVYGTIGDDFVDFS